MTVIKVGDRVVLFRTSWGSNPAFASHVGKAGVVVKDHPTHPTVRFDDGVELCPMWTNIQLEERITEA